MIGIVNTRGFAKIQLNRLFYILDILHFHTYRKITNLSWQVKRMAKDSG